ncbi:hypothetical protein A374_15172 [Fictibacillus macauensis ZFHKF-1]|uniref:Uncharacterized protein n=1 Tax=Fictibacillus macauensis ZFHKF-1 TaxID=1196324 RepID=I8UCI2_9BACL|nr:hypothetical protein [Fictibacillus macauensis]EIT84478.1 hypothetical protein A374_15172 [Fictibacillus macauensis ZFHKF-1]
MKGRINLVFDWKVMGANAYIPVFVSVLLIGYSALTPDSVAKLLPVLEFCYPVCAAWWVIFIFQDVLEETGSETLFSYPLSRWKLGVVRAFLFYLLFLVLLIVTVCMIDWIATGALFPSLFVQLGMEAFFFSGVGFLAITLTRNTGWSLVIVIIYLSSQLLTRGAFIPVLNVFLFNQALFSLQDLMAAQWKTVVLGLCLWAGGQYAFQRLEKFN